MRSMAWLPGRRPNDGDAVVGDAPPADSHPTLGEMLAALTDDPRPHELDGLGQALSAYRAANPRARVSHATTARRASVFTGLLTTKAAAALGGAALGLGATALVVSLSLPNTDAHPAPVSPAATTPAATPVATETDDRESVGPDATGPAAHGLCTAWSRHQANGSTDALESVAMRNLVQAAGGGSKVQAYCATIKHPGKGGSPKSTNKNDTDKGKGKSGTAPNGPKPKQSATSRATASTPAAPTGTPSPSTSPTLSPTASAT